MNGRTPLHQFSTSETPLGDQDIVTLSNRILTWQKVINYFHQATPKNTPSKKLAILDPPTRQWPYKPFLHLTEGKSHSTNTRHRINASHTFTTALAPPLSPSNPTKIRSFLSIIPSLVDSDSPHCDMYNTYVTRHNLWYLSTYIIIYSWIWLMYSLQESNIVYASTCHDSYL
jgi:hypothetical protein